MAKAIILLEIEPVVINEDAEFALILKPPLKFYGTASKKQTHTAIKYSIEKSWRKIKRYVTID